MESAVSATLSALFSTLVEHTAGIYYGVNDRAIFESKLIAHAADSGYDTLLDYYYRLRYDDPSGDELRKLLDALVVHETYFFRELPPLVELVDTVLTDAVRKRGRARVWSAACATGEEPLTLAMLLDDRGLLDRVEVIATDLSAPAIRRACSGRFGRRSLRDGFPQQLAARYLTEGDGGIGIDPKILAAVRFRTLNLASDDEVRAVGELDAIICRNVLIYFRDEQAARVVDRLTRALVPGGTFLVGVSESLLRFGTALRCEEHAGCFFYRSVK